MVELAPRSGFGAPATASPVLRSPPGDDVVVPTYDVVVPTIGSASLLPLVSALLAQAHRAADVIVVDDRRSPGEPLPLPCSPRLRVLRSDGRGPAAARNVGWRAGRSPWVVFVDEDVVLPLGWSVLLAEDLGAATSDVAGISGRVHVPLPADRRATDNERHVAGLAGARWNTVDMAYRRDALETVGGFDERYPRAHREDIDLALRVQATGLRLERGMRVVQRPVAPAPWWISVARQRDNADDARLFVTHGGAAVRAAGVPRGRRPVHLVTAAAGVTALVAGALHRRRVAPTAAAVWAACTADLARVRIGPGPKEPEEVASMVVTSVAIPPAATWWWIRGLLRVARR